MASEATIGAATSAPGVTSRPAIRNAGRVLGVAGVLGIVGQLLFFDVGLGINFPIAITVLLAAGWLFRRRRSWPVGHDVWLGPAAIAFAAFAAVRADPTIVFLDVVTSLALAGFALASLSGRQVVALPFSSLVRLAIGALGWAVTGAAPAVGGRSRSGAGGGGDWPSRGSGHAGRPRSRDRGAGRGPVHRALRLGRRRLRPPGR